MPSVIDFEAQEQNLATFKWLLWDAKGNVATEYEDGAVMGQKAYDPYGAPDAGGSSKTRGERHSLLGFQAAHTDEVTGQILLGEANTIHHREIHDARRIHRKWF